MNENGEKGCVNFDNLSYTVNRDSFPIRKVDTPKCLLCFLNFMLLNIKIVLFKLN